MTTITKTKKAKLCVRNETIFKKPSSCSSSSFYRRRDTILKKAYELSTLCDVDVCVICYDREGELIKTWPEDRSKVRDMAERFSRLNEKERRKKSTNLSQALYKKIINDKKTSLDNKDGKFSEKVLAMEKSLDIRLRVFQEKLIRLLNFKKQTELTDQSVAVSSGLFTTNVSSSSGLIEEPLDHKSDKCRYEQDLGFTTDLSPLLIEDSHQQWTESLMSGVSSTEQDLSTSLLNQHQSNKFSLFLYNHDNGSFCQLPDSVSSFDQSMTPYNNLTTALLEPQGFGLSSYGNNIDLPMVFPPQMQTQNPLVHFDQFSSWSQTPPSFGDPMMFPS